MSSSNKPSEFDILRGAASEPLDSQREKTRSRQEQEEKLILAAWQSMQHGLSEKTSAAPSAPQSFLAKQRCSTQARRPRSAQMDPR